MALSLYTTFITALPERRGLLLELHGTGALLERQNRKAIGPQHIKYVQVLCTRVADRLWPSEVSACVNQRPQVARQQPSKGTVVQTAL